LKYQSLIIVSDEEIEQKKLNKCYIRPHGAPATSGPKKARAAGGNAGFAQAAA